jgi:hypothetical protein
MGVAMEDHPARPRIAEVLVTQAGEDRRGSGYLVAPGWVLTAAHVVADAQKVAVWLDAPQILEDHPGVGVDPRRILLAADADLALLPVGRSHAEWVEPVLLGQLDRTSMDAVSVAAAGCPRFKLRAAPGRPGVQLRELHVAIGTIVAGSDAKTGTLELAVERAPAEDPQPDEHSPWEGMSGAVVWASGRLVGVVGQHHPREGPGMLTVRPLTALFEAVTVEELAVWQQALPQLPARAEDLSLAALPSVRELVVRRAQKAANDLVPKVLVARAEELADLAAFVGSPQRWRWVQGTAFAGKSALLAWFALHPPKGVEVAACFLRRTTGQARADYALDVLTRQLARLASRPDYQPAPFLGERVDDFTDLLEDAALACQQLGRRLLILVDGLDEDQTVERGLRVARWLPDDEILPDNAWLLVASRAGVPIPLPDGHPLTAHTYRLMASVAASELQTLAEDELEEALNAGGLVYDLLGLLAAAIGGLTVSEFAELIRRDGRPNISSVEIEKELDRLLARSVSAVMDPEEFDEPVRVFAHDALLDYVQMRYTRRRDLPSYHDRIDRWAQEYQQQGWPPTTPPYLLRLYTSQLASQARNPATTPERWRQVIETLYQIVTDPARSTRLLERTGNPAISDQEVTTTQHLLVDNRGRSGIDNHGELVYRLAVLALARRPLTGTLASVAASVSSVWAQTGRFRSALAIAAGIEDPGRRAQALVDAVGRLAQVGQVDQIIKVADGIEDPGRRAQALVDAAGRLAERGQADQAIEVAGGIDDPKERAQALVDAAGGLAKGGQVDLVIEVAGGIDDPKERARALVKAAQRLTWAGQADRAVSVAAEVTQIAGGIEDLGQRAEVLGDLARRLAWAGQVDRAIEVAGDIEDPWRRAEALVDVAQRLAEVGQADRAAGLAAQAAQLAGGLQDAEERAGALAGVAVALAQAGQVDQAMEVAGGIEDLGQRAQALVRIVGALAQVGQVDQAIEVAGGIEELGQRAGALADVAVALAQAGQADRAAGLAAQAAQIAGGIEDPGQRARALGDLAGRLAWAGQVDQIVKAAAAIEDSERRTWALAGVAGRLAEREQADQAIKAATGINDPKERIRVLATVAHSAEGDRGGVVLHNAVYEVLLSPYARAYLAAVVPLRVLERLLAEGRLV